MRSLALRMTVESPLAVRSDHAASGAAGTQTIPGSTLLGALASLEEMKPVLVELVVRELARIHDLDVAFLRGQLIDTHAWSWSHDPYTMGTYRLFSAPSLPPGPHRTHYPQARSRSSGPASSTMSMRA